MEEAVALLDRLANTVDEIDPRLLEAYVGFWEGEGLSGAETQSEMLRGVAFNLFRLVSLPCHYSPP
jgi:hypothetical protein